MRPLLLILVLVANLVAFWGLMVVPEPSPVGPVQACGAQDPVSDPAYNMREIAKQSVLLEEHLVEPQKYCRDCIAKHFLHIIGLAEEAQMLATVRVGQYPHMQESAPAYRELFQRWLDKGQSEATAVAEELRTRRKKLVEAYIL